MNINYSDYVVFPYTVERLKKLYPQDSIKNWGDQLAFLFQNGFTLQDNSPAMINEQMNMFNGFKSYEDFEDMKKTFGKAGSFEEPTAEGYKIVDSLLEYILNTSSTVGLRKFQDIKSAGCNLKNTIKKMADYFSALVESDDLEVVRVIKVIAPDGVADLVEECFDAYEDERYGLLLEKYQALYQQISEMHKKCYRALLSSSEKGLQARMGNVNDELYGSSGGYNPNDNAIKCRNGSLVFELKTLADKSVKTEDIRIKMLVIAQEAVDNGEDDKILLAFLKGDKSRLEEVRKILIEIDLSGCMVLLSLKHGLTMFEDSLNGERAKRIAHEFSAICNYVGINGFELKA
jgi:hypothetical protein